MARRGAAPEPAEQKTGRCWWCWREGVLVGRGWDRLFKCVDREACRSARYQRLTLGGSRPQSWYERLADGVYAVRREARRSGLTDEQLRELVEARGLVWAARDRKPREEELAEDA